MLRKIVTVLMLTIAMLATTCTTAEAKEALAHTNRLIMPGGDVVTPMWVSTNYVRTTASANGTTVNASVVARASNLNTYCSGTLYVDRYQNGSWVCVASWGVSGTGTINTTRRYSGNSGYTYRCRANLQIGSDQIASYSSNVTVR